MTEKLTDYRYKTTITLRFCDIDAVGHVNNAIYLTYFEEARLRYFREAINWDWTESGIIVGRSEVTYHKPILLHEEIYCYVRTSRIGNSSFDMMHVLVKATPNGEEICTTGKSVLVSFDYKANKSVPIPQTERARMIEYDQPGLILNTN